MKNILSIAVILSLFSSFQLMSQQKNANISFDKTVHEFGQLKEADGIATYKFEFTNTGNEPLIIQRVNPSCGCTTPSWTKEPVMPGERGYVSAAFNPKNRPGHFDKTLAVQTNSSIPTVTLRIKGSVIPKPLTIEDEYRYEMGNVRLKSNHLSFGTVYKGTPQTRMLELINTSDQTQKIEIRDVPSHLKVNVLTPVLKPDAKGQIEVTYLSDLQNDWDFIIDRLNIYFNGTTDRNYKLIVSANIQEDFSKLTEEEKAKAAKINFEEKNFDFGNLKQGEKVEYEYVFTNTGKSDLIIRKVKASCGCTAVNMAKSVIAPGETGKIKTTFNSAGKRGKQNKTITVVTNDPNNPREILWIRGDILAQ
jgi:hypothetical protein